MTFATYLTRSKTFLLLLVLGTTWAFLIVNKNLSAAAIVGQATTASVSKISLTNPPATHLLSTASRLQKRIAHWYGITLSTDDILPGLREQRMLLSRNLSVEFIGDGGDSIATMNADVEQHAFWLTPEIKPGSLTYSLNTAAVQNSVQESLPDDLPAPADASILSVVPAQGISKVETDGIAKTGYVVDTASIAKTISEAIRSEKSVLRYSLPTQAGRMHNASGIDVGEMRLLSTGKSNFAGSGLGRKFNVRKGLNQHLHNIFIKAGEEFSLNSIFKNVPIGEWEMALGIFNGGDLKMIPGGGICQVATTLYRAVLHAGLPVTKRNSHSLFVTYYEKYGVGIDATIFPGTAQDLKFVNDTGHPLLVQAYTDGDEATVNVYGTPDGRAVQLTGPYFSSTAPKGFLVRDGRKMASNEIGWVQTVAHADGRTEEHTVLSRYKAVPKSIVKKYADAVATTALPVVHASAPSL